MWRPAKGFKRPLGEDHALIWGESDEHEHGSMHIRYKFPCGAEITQGRLHALLDEARSLGRTEITLD